MRKLLFALCCMLLISCTDNNRYTPLTQEARPNQIGVLDTKTGVVYMFGFEENDENVYTIDPINGTRKITQLKPYE